MAPSSSPSFNFHALDVRQPEHGTHNHRPDVFEFLAAREHDDAHHASGGTSPAVAVLAVLLVLVCLGAGGAGYYIYAQRKKLRNLGTIRVEYNVDPLKQGSVNVSTDKLSVADSMMEKSIPLEAGEQMYTIDLSSDAKPRFVPAPATPNEPAHMLPPPSLRRKHTRTVARQRLRIVIPSGVAIPDVELVTTATTATLPPAAVSTPGTAVSSAVRSGGMLSRRNTARTPKSALSSAVTAISTAAIGIVQRREKVETVMQSNGWAPATIVYLPKNPRDAAASGAPSLVRKTTTRKSVRRTEKAEKALMSLAQVSPPPAAA